MQPRTFPRLAIRIVTVVLAWATSAQAGAPLICHPFEIGQARSLPWISWNATRNENYDLKNLTRDTVAILDSKAPVLVRMETLRRAAIYVRHDPQIAKELLIRLHARATSSEAAGHPDALAWFDAGYLVETYQQWIGKDGSNPARGLDGYSWVKKAISLRGPDPEMEFAAALITLRGPESDHREHLQKAMAGQKSDPLLAQNLADHFIGNQGQSNAEMLSNAGTADRLKK